LRDLRNHNLLEFKLKEDPEGYWISEHYLNGAKIGSITLNTKDKETAKETIKNMFTEIIEHINDDKDSQMRYVFTVK
jgi:hypothetical protein